MFIQPLVLVLSVSRQENELENERKRERWHQRFYFLPSFSPVLLRWQYYLGIVSVQIKDQSENMSVASSYVQLILHWVSQQP